MKIAISLFFEDALQPLQGTLEEEVERFEWRWKTNGIIKYSGIVRFSKFDIFMLKHCDDGVSIKTGFCNSCTLSLFSHLRIRWISLVFWLHGSMQKLRYVYLFLFSVFLSNCFDPLYQVSVWQTPTTEMAVLWQCCQTVYFFVFQ